MSHEDPRQKLTRISQPSATRLRPIGYALIVAGVALVISLVPLSYELALMGMVLAFVLVASGAICCFRSGSYVGLGIAVVLLLCIGTMFYRVSDNSLDDMFKEVETELRKTKK